MDRLTTRRPRRSTKKYILVEHVSSMTSTNDDLVSSARVPLVRIRGPLSAALGDTAERRQPGAPPSVSGKQVVYELA